MSDDLDCLLFATFSLGGVEAGFQSILPVCSEFLRVS